MVGNLRLNDNYLSGDGGDEGLFVDSSGKVGVGLTNPTSALDVNGLVRLRPTDLTLYAAASTRGDVVVDSSNGNALKWFNGLSWRTVLTVRVTLDRA